MDTDPAPDRQALDADPNPDPLKLCRQNIDGGGGYHKYCGCGSSMTLNRTKGGRRFLSVCTPFSFLFPENAVNFHHLCTVLNFHHRPRYGSEIKELVFVNLLRSPGIDSHPAGPVRHPISLTGPPGCIVWRKRYL
jgi:hypothetical protein